MPTRDYDLGGDSSELVEALDKAADALRDVLDAVEVLEKKIDVAGDTAEKAAKKGEKGLIDWKKAADGAVTGTAALVGGVFAASAAYADAATKIADSARELDYFHTRTGLSTDTLGGLRRAAEQTGGTLDDLVPEDLGTRIVEALEGTGEGARVFELLGVSVRDTSGNVRDAEGIFRDYVDAMAGLEDQTIAAGLADDLFSDQGTRLLHVLQDGTATLDKYTASAAEFGYKTGPEASEASKRWAGSVAALQLAFEDATAQIVGPTMSAASTFINEFALGFMFIKDVAIGTFTRIDDQIVRIGKLLTGQIGVTEFFAESLDALTDPWEEAHERAYKFFQATNMGLEGVADTARSTNRKITIEDERVVKARADARKEEEREEAKHQALLQRLREDTYKYRIGRLIDELDAIKDSIEKVEKEYEEAREKRKEDIDDAINEGLGFAETIGDAFETMAGRMVDALSGILDDLQDQRGRVADAISAVDEQIAESDSKAKTIVLQNQRDVLEGQKEALKAREREIKDATIRAFHTEQAGALSSIVFNTAVAIMQAWAQLGPLAAGFATGGIAVAGGIQAAAVMAEQPPLHSGGLAADEGMVAGRLMRAGEALAVVNQRGAEKIDAINRDTGGGGDRSMRLVLADAGRVIGEAVMLESERPGSPLAAAGSPSAIDPYRRPR